VASTAALYARIGTVRQRAIAKARIAGRLVGFLATVTASSTDRSRTEARAGTEYLVITILAPAPATLLTDYTIVGVEADYMRN
jgi:hypothetical protein